MSGSQVSFDIREREDDLIWRVHWEGEWLYVYILLEFQSTVDKWMAVRIMTYIGLLYEDLIRTKKLTGNGELPPVLPIVLHNGDTTWTTWTAATSISELMPQIPGKLTDYQPRLKYLLISELEYIDHELEPLKNLVAALFQLENSKNPTQIIMVLEKLLKWLAEPKQDSLRRAFTVWVKRVLYAKHKGLGNPPAIEELKEVKSMLAERMREWEQQWKKEGEQKGKQEGAADVLTGQLESKFGYLNPSVQERLQAADMEQLQLWAMRILTAKSLEEVFDN